MSISERIGETAANTLLPGVRDTAGGKHDEVIAQSGVNLLGIEDSAVAQMVTGLGTQIVSGVRRKVTDTVTQTGDNTVTATDVAEAGSIERAAERRKKDRFQEEYVAEPIATNTDKKATELAVGTFRELGYSDEQAAQMTNDTIAGGLVKGAHAAGLRKYDAAASEAAELMRERAPVSTNTHVPGGGKDGSARSGITAGDAGLSAEILHEELQNRAINDRAFAGMSGEDVNTLVSGRIRTGSYDQSPNDFQRGKRIAEDAASDASAVRNLKKVYGEDASAQDVLQQTRMARGSDIRNMSASRRDALTSEAARVAQNTGMTSQELTIAAASGRGAAAEKGLTREAGYRIGLSAQKQIGAGDIRVEGLDTEQYRQELSSVMAEAGESGAVTDAAAGYRAYLDVSGAKDTDETFAEWQKQTADIDFSDSAQAQNYIGKTLGVSGSKAADAYDAYSRSKDTRRMAESRDFYSGALQKKVDSINKTAKIEQQKALKGAGIKLDKVFKDDVEYNSMTQQERKDKIRDYARKEGKDLVEVEAALSRSDALFETTAEYHGMSAEAADQAIVSTRKNKDLADRPTEKYKQYSKGMEGVSQRLAENQREGRETSISDIATTVVTGTSREDLEKASEQVEDSLNLVNLESAEEKIAAQQAAKAARAAGDGGAASGLAGSAGQFDSAKTYESAVTRDVPAADEQVASASLSNSVKRQNVDTDVVASNKSTSSLADPERQARSTASYKNSGDSPESRGLGSIEMGKQSSIFSKFGEDKKGGGGELAGLHEAATKAISSMSEKSTDKGVAGALNAILDTLNQIKNKLG